MENNLEEKNEEAINFREALNDFVQGKPVLIADDTNRENEVDLICSAEYVTPDIINFMAKECRGLICLAMTSKRARKLKLTPMVDENTEGQRTAFTQSIDGAAKFGVTTGISAFDRAKTVEIVVNSESTPEDLYRPGHMFPCISKDGGVFERKGHTEAAVDMAKLCRHFPAAVMCEIMLDNGKMAKRDDLGEFMKKHNLKMITVEQIMYYRMRHNPVVKRVAAASLPSEYGNFFIVGYENRITKDEHIALVKDDRTNKIPLVRVHSECFTGDVLHSLKCDCNSQLHSAMKMINDYGKGAVVYIRNHEGRGIGLNNKIKAYALQDKGQDTVEANVSLGFEPDLRDYNEAAQIIYSLGYNEFNLITNNPDKIEALKKYGLCIKDIIKAEPEITEYNKKYLDTKKEKMHHML